MNPSRIFPRASLSIITSTLTCNLHVSILISIQFRVRILCRLAHWYPPNGNCGCTACPRTSWHVAEGKAIAERERLNAEIAATETLIQRRSTYVLSSAAQPSEVKCRLMGWSHRRKRRMTVNGGGSGPRHSPRCLYGIIQSGLMKKGDRSHSGRRWKMGLELLER